MGLAMVILWWQWIGVESLLFDQEDAVANEAIILQFAVLSMHRSVVLTHQLHALFSPGFFHLAPSSQPNRLM